MLLLTPQNVLVRSESNSSTTEPPILIDIVNVVPMMLAQMKNPHGFYYVTGVDRLFLAPELNLGDVGPYNDVWSVGAILYLMITGGRSSKRPVEKFKFKEEVWGTVSKRLKNFLTEMLQVAPEYRPEVDDLLRHMFIKASNNGSLSQYEIQETNLAVDGSNLMQFQMAFCLNQIATKRAESQTKMRNIESMRDAMQE